jgi:GDP-L-fucose synthase
MNVNDTIAVFGDRGLVGSAIIRNLKAKGYNNIVTIPRHWDLRNQRTVYDFFAQHRIDYVFLAAARVGGIKENATYPAEFIYDNLMIQTNVIDAAHKHRVKKFCFLGSACIYPKLAPVPIKEDSLMQGMLEPTNEAYAMAKLAGYMMCKKYHEQYGFNAISLMPTNLYGPGDNFKPEAGHVIPGLIEKFRAAKEGNYAVECWGDGTPTREFMYVDDMADATVFLMNNYNDPDFINVGTGIEISIATVAGFIADKMGYKGDLVWDTSKPNGTPRRALNCTKLFGMGWRSKTDLSTGLDRTIEWYLNTLDKK